MTILFVILIIVASVLLGLIVLIQNPKGGGLAGNIAGFSNQLMGVKQTTDVLEKLTWVFAGAIAILCLLSAFFISSGTSGGGSSLDRAKGASIQSQPVAPPAANPNTVTLPGDSIKK